MNGDVRIWTFLTLHSSCVTDAEKFLQFIITKTQIEEGRKRKRKWCKRSKTNRRAKKKTNKRMRND